MELNKLFIGAFIILLLGLSTYSIFSYLSLKKDLQNTNKNLENLKDTYKQEILSSLNACENIEFEGPHEGISCDDVCTNNGKVCIYAESGNLPIEEELSNSLGSWLFQPVSCNIKYALSNPKLEKIQCQCCS